ncbi:type II secretion system F family protein [Actinoplanes sp. NBRC 101535]|uniref:type II secretion system F family protein n=1 Tax=Actinoplanes sp. NBRC 101535 TaxID=3032196 RepID=UPI0024A26369|nr:type II secretion system F family protein [Actinoplanes sp. NBRC 101535]GLY02636.1 hypothetical protein Acsp01_30150 [Actinoplanes sp. NBRC 101535]
MLIGLLAGFSASFMIAYVILMQFFGKTPMQRRLAVLRQFSVRRDDAEPPLIRRELARAGRWVEDQPALLKIAEQDIPMLDRLGGVLRPGEWLVVRAIVGAILGAVLAFFLPLPFLMRPAGFLIGFLAGFLGARLALRSKITRRERTFNDELPGALQLLMSSLRSGFTLQQSVEAAVRDDDGPVAVELRRALAETRISGDFEDALERIGERMNSTEMTWLVMALRLQKEVGGSVVEVMETTADTMKERAYLFRQVRALSGEGRISAYVLTALPVFAAVMIYVSNPGYLKPLFTEPLGIVMLAVAIFMMIVGSFWLRAIVRVEV